MIYHERTPLDRLEEEIEQVGSQREWARRHGYSAQYVHDILKGRRQISDAVAQTLGFQRVTTWKSIDPSKNA